MKKTFFSGRLVPMVALLISLACCVLLIKAPLNKIIFLIVLSTGVIAIAMFIITTISLVLQNLLRFFDRKFNSEDIVKKRPFGIKFISFLYFLGLANISYLFRDVHVPVFGMVVGGVWAKLWYFSWIVIGLYIAIGFLRLLKSAWIICVISSLFWVIIGMVNYFFLTNAEMLQLIAAPVKNELIFINTCKLGAVFGVIISLLFLLYIYSKRKIFNVEFNL